MLQPEVPAPDAAFETPKRSLLNRAAETVLYSLAGGYADALGFLISGSFTGHITGNLVLLTISLVKNRWWDAFRPLVAVFAFLTATEVGLRLATRIPGLSRWLLLWMQCLLICSVALPVVRHSTWYDVDCILAFCLSLGMQNGIITSSSGTTVHSTYLSGTATRLLQSLNHPAGQTSKGTARPDSDRATSPIFVSLSVIVSFLTGAFLAVAANSYFKDYAPYLLCLPLSMAAVVTRSIPRPAPELAAPSRGAAPR
jgi:uncharacterized membrane protein YoaK (UPF0700 family)